MAIMGSRRVAKMTVPAATENKSETTNDAACAACTLSTGQQMVPSPIPSTTGRQAVVCADPAACRVNAQKLGIWKSYNPLDFPVKKV